MQLSKTLYMRRKPHSIRIAQLLQRPRRIRAHPRLFERSHNISYRIQQQTDTFSRVVHLNVRNPQRGPTPSSRIGQTRRAEIVRSRRPSSSPRARRKPRGVRPDGCECCAPDTVRAGAREPAEDVWAKESRERGVWVDGECFLD